MERYFTFKLTIITKDSRGKKATIARKNRNVYELSPPQKLNPQTEFPIDDLRNERNGALRGLQRHRYTSGLLISVYFLGKKPMKISCLFIALSIPNKVTILVSSHTKLDLTFCTSRKRRMYTVYLMLIGQILDFT